MVAWAWTGVLCTCLLLLSCSAQPMVVEDSEESSKDVDDLPTTTPPSVEVTTPSTAKNCTTARNEAGMCVVRVHCEHSTTAIDHTLYATRNYVKPCKSEEVCCPFEFVVPEGGTPDNMKSQDDDNAAFEFDEDD